VVIEFKLIAPKIDKAPAWCSEKVASSSGSGHSSSGSGHSSSGSGHSSSGSGHNRDRMAQSDRQTSQRNCYISNEIQTE